MSSSNLWLQFQPTIFLGWEQGALLLHITYQFDEAYSW